MLRDEKKIGGTLLDTSEPFLLSHSSKSEALSVCIENLNPDIFNCKYNVNFQDIPLNHIWNGRNHLLHCTFTFERINDSISEQFECTIKGFLKSSTQQIDLNVGMNIQYNLSNLIYSSTYEESNEFLTRCLTKWEMTSSILSSPAQLTSPKNLQRKYFKVDKNVKNEICSLLDDTFSREKNWKTLASKLGINRNLHYFASKASPTEMLLLYFEAISDLKSNDYIRFNTDLAVAARSSNADYSLSTQESLFHKYFLSCLIQSINTNEDLVK